MAGLISVSQIKEHLTFCPICYHEYDELEHLPRRMPCCVQAICHPCLEKIWNNNKLRCPICRKEHTLPEGVTSLPKESLMLKILDYLKVQNGLGLPCTDCRDGNVAQYRCDDCAVFLCEECHKAHARLKPTSDHKTVTFEEMKGRPVKSFRKLHQCRKHHQPQQFYCRTCKLVICVSCTVVDHDKTKDHDVVSVEEAHQEKAKSTDDVVNNLDHKVVKLERQVKELEEKQNNIKNSRVRAKEDVNRTIDNLIELLKKRRASLLSDVDTESDKKLKVTDKALDATKSLLAKVKSSTEYTRKMRKKADKVEDLQLMVSSTDTLNTMLQETAPDVEFHRTGVTFAPVQVTEIKALIDVVGSVRTVTYNAVEKPSGVPADRYYNAITMEPVDIPEVVQCISTPSTLSLGHIISHVTHFVSTFAAFLEPSRDRRTERLRPSGVAAFLEPSRDTGFDGFFTAGDTLFVCPTLELDPNTASDDVKISSSMVSNIRPKPAPPDTGCRLHSGRRAITQRPIPKKIGDVIIFSTKVAFTVKQPSEKNFMLWETAVTSSPVDTNCSQTTGLRLRLVACCSHEMNLCLRVVYGGESLTDVPLSKNQIGESAELHLCIMIDIRLRKIHVVDVNKVELVTTIPDVTLRRPLWVLILVDVPSDTEMRSELISGKKLKVTGGLKNLLVSLK